MGGKNDDALAMANEFLAKSREKSDSILSMVAHRVMGSTLLTIGEFENSRGHFEKSIELSKTGRRQSVYTSPKSAWKYSGGLSRLRHNIRARENASRVSGAA